LSISEDEFLEEYLLCKSYLEIKWFKRYELSNFAKAWFECKHNKSYWNHSDLIAFWLWSHWYLDDTRYAYPNNFKDYYWWILEFKEKLTENDLFLEKIMFWLRTIWLEKKLYEKLNQKKIKYFIEQKLLNFENNKLLLSDNWVTLIDYIIKEII
jgi:oxygen-independent coproporphyrinogen-3 oxidase